MRVLLSSEIINDFHAKSSRKIMRERNSTPPKLEKRAPKLAASAPILRAGFSSFGGVEFRYLTICLEDVAWESLIIPEDNTRIVCFFFNRGPAYLMRRLIFKNLCKCSPLAQRRGVETGLGGQFQRRGAARVAMF